MVQDPSRNCFHRRDHHRRARIGLGFGFGPRTPLAVATSATSSAAVAPRRTQYFIPDSVADHFTNNVADHFINNRFANNL